MGVRVGVVAIAVLVAVAGCSGGESSTELPAGSAPPQSSSPPSDPPTTAATTPPPTAPTLPAAARPDTPTAAESFARYWMAVLDYATVTGDTGRLLALGRCASCRALAKSIDSLYTAGGKAEGGHISIVSSSVVRHVPRSAALVRLKYDQAAGREITGNGAARTTPAKQNLALAFTLGRREDIWTVVKVQTVETR